MPPTCSLHFLPLLVCFSKPSIGRSVDAEEAHAIGLANRVVPRGRALIEAEQLALQLASFPQGCMLADRQSAYEQFSLPLIDALRMEFERGSTVLQTESLRGATQFAVEVRNFFFFGPTLSVVLI